MKVLPRSFKNLALIALTAIVPCFLKAGISRYAVPQQPGYGCPLYPWLILNHLNFLSQKYEGDLSKITPEDFLDKRAWYAITFPYCRNWATTVNNLIMATENNAFKFFFNAWKENGIYYGKIYNSQGQLFHEAVSKNLFDPLSFFESHARKALMPFTLVQLTSESEDMLSSAIRMVEMPIYLDKNTKQWFCYNPKAKSFKAVDGLYGEAPLKLCESLSQLTTEQQQYLGLTEILSEATSEVPGTIEAPKDFSDHKLFEEYLRQLQRQTEESLRKFKAQSKFYERICYMPSSGSTCLAYYYFDPSISCAPYMTGLYMLTLLGLGIDYTTGECFADLDDQKLSLVQRHLFAAHRVLQQSLSQYTENPWSFKGSFNPQNFFEYRLAQLFKTNTELKARVEGVVNLGLFKGYSYYKIMSGLYDSKDLKNRRSLSSLMQDFLPCENLILAYEFSQSLRMLWLYAKSIEAFATVLELDSKEKLFLPLLGYKIFGGQGVVDEFCGVWSEIREMFLKSNVRNLASFPEHGLVWSFDSSLFKLQSQKPVYDKWLMQQLGVVMIDPHWGAEIDNWYRIEEQ